MKNNNESPFVSMNLSYNQKNYKISLYDIGNDSIKIIGKEINNNNDIIILNKYGIIIKFEELKNLHRYFKMFDTFNEVKDNINLLCQNNAMNIIKITNKEIIINFNLGTLTNDKMIITLTKINNNDKEDINLLINNINQKNKEISELKDKINNLETIITNLSKKVEILEAKSEELTELREKLKKLENKVNKLENTNDRNLINNSKILEKAEELNLLYNAISKDNKLSFKLLYNSDIEGENETKLKSAYLNKNDIIIFIKTDKGNRFGGYAHEAFKERLDFAISDIKAFLFSLDKLKIYNSKGGDNTIWNNEDNSIDFGSGTDLRIYHKFYHYNNYASNGNFDYNYHNSNENYSLNGEKYFKVKYLEIYKVIFT